MIRIIIGVIVFIIGFGSYLAAQSSPTGGTIWTGGMIFGGILVISGINSVLRQRR